MKVNSKLKSIVLAKEIAERYKWDNREGARKIFERFVKKEIGDIFKNEEDIYLFIKELGFLERNKRKIWQFSNFFGKIESLLDKSFGIKIKYLITFSVTKHSNGYRLIDLDSFDDKKKEDLQKYLEAKRQVIHFLRKMEEDEIRDINYSFIFLPIYNFVNNDILWVVVLEPIDYDLSDEKIKFLFNLIFFYTKDLIYNIFLLRKDKVIVSERLDDLTQLYKRKFIEEKIKEYLSCSKNDFVLLMIDLDNFKKINDLYGHIVGDKVLKALSRAIRKSIKWNIDYPARRGGEEFIIMFDGNIIEKNKNNLQEILKDIIYRIYDNFQKEISKIQCLRGKNITFSWWYSYSNEVKNVLNIEDKISTIITLCDTRLYKAKDTGKAKVILPDWTTIKLWK